MTSSILGKPTVTLTFPVPGNFVQNVGALHDFNGDGHVDYLAAYSSFDSNWHVADINTPLRMFLGDGKGGFTLATASVIGAPIPGTTAPTDMLLADLNGDGHLDVFIPDHGYDDLPYPGHANVLLLSDATGSQLIPEAIHGAPLDFSIDAGVGDIDGDGDIDIFVCNFGGSGTQIGPYFLLNNGAGAFTVDDARVPAPYNGSTDYRYTAALLRDVDQDGDPDLILGTGGRVNPHSVLLRNDGQGNFTDATNLPAAPDFGPSTAPDGRGTGALDIDAVDINGDGRVDILVSYTSSFALGGYLQFNIQNPDGSFADRTAEFLPQSTSSAASALWSTVFIDMDGDDDLDIVAFYQDHVGLFTNDGQGHFSQSDTLDVWTRAPSVADVNGDMLPDVVWADPTHVDDNDNLWVSLNQYRSGRDKLKGTSADDSLKGFGEKDKLDGKAGADWLWGGFGPDVLKGGKGADVFAFHALADSTVKAAGRDLILDFNRKKGDKIDISDIVATSGVVQVSFIGSKKFSGDGAEIRYVKAGGKGLISADFDGNGEADFAIALAKATALKEGDFLM